MSDYKIVIHTDIFIQYLIERRKEETVLRLVMKEFFCYTTVFNAIELFSLARTLRERVSVEDALSGMKILGLNAKSAKSFGAMISKGLKLRRMNALIAGICFESKLPILTGQPDEFRGVKGVRVIPATAVGKHRSAAEILGAARFRPVTS